MNVFIGQYFKRYTDVVTFISCFFCSVRADRRPDRRCGGEPDRRRQRQRPWRDHGPPQHGKEGHNLGFVLCLDM